VRICQICADQRNAASAYAPLKRDEMLQKLEKKMAELEDARPHNEQEQRKRKMRASDCTLKRAPAPATCAPHNERDPIGPAYQYSELSGFKRSRTNVRNYQVDCHGDSTLNEAFTGIVKDWKYGWPEEVRSIQNYWQSLHHLAKGISTGIPPLPRQTTPPPCGNSGNATSTTLSNYAVVSVGETPYRLSASATIGRYATWMRMMAWT